MEVTVIKYPAGNIQSVLFALHRLGVSAHVTNDPEEIRAADKVIFPGVGEASTAMRALRERNIDKVIPDLAQPFLGICLGMQLLCGHSDEGNTECLGVFPFRVRRFEGAFKVPQIGWNEIRELRGPLFKGVREGEFCYFVHSYCVDPCESTVARCDYWGEFSAALESRNFFGVQFHPEKSAKAGETILRNFLAL